MNKATGRESDKFMLRLPTGMRDKLKDAATDNNRSLNAEIVARLEQSFEPLPTRLAAGGEFIDLLAEMSERVVRKIRQEERAAGLPPLDYDPPLDSTKD